jgi:hypothetical protein
MRSCLPTSRRPKTSGETQEESAKIADEQDELSADVQQLVVEQTIPKVIELLTEVEDIMDEATDLAEADTGGETIAAQTEIIEKIHAAAKEKQSAKGGSSKPGGAMMDMMERMMGKKPEEGKPKKGNTGSDTGGGEASPANRTPAMKPPAAKPVARARPAEFPRPVAAAVRKFPRNSGKRSMPTTAVPRPR